MSEIIKDLRWISRLQLTIALIVIIFTLSPTKEKELSIALAELHAVEKIDFQRYEMFAHSFVRYREEGNNKNILEKIKGHISDVSISDELEIILPVFALKPHASSKIKEYKEFLTGPNSVSYAVYSNGPIEYYESILSRGASSGEDLVLKGVKLVPIDYQEVLLDFNRSNYKKDFTKDENANFETILIYDIGNHTFSKEGGNISKHHIGKSAFSTEIAFNYLKEYQSDIFSDIYGEKENQYSALSETSKFWALIKDLELGDATRKLNDELNKEKRNLSISGITVPGELASWAAPVGLITISVYFLASLYCFNSLKHQRQEFDSNVLWLPLYGAFLPQTISLAMNVIIPFSADILISYRLWPDTNFNLYIGLSILALHLFILILIQVQLRKCSKRIEKKLANKSFHRTRFARHSSWR